MKNEFKDYITKNIKYKNHKEYLELADAIESNEQQKVLDIICKIYFEGRMRW